MGLRMRITGKSVNPDQTLTVNYELAWVDSAGAEVWLEKQQQVYAGNVTVQQVVSDLRQVAESRAGIIAASVGLDSLVGKTYELQSNGTWKAV